VFFVILHRLKASDFDRNNSGGPFFQKMDQPPSPADSGHVSIPYTL